MAERIPENKVIVPLDSQLPALAEALNVSLVTLQFHLATIRADSEFLSLINKRAAGEPSFDSTRFKKTQEFRAWREALYVCVRALRPNVTIETGVHHGFSTALILRALQKNAYGGLFSVDLDPASEEYKGLDKSLQSLPAGNLPGWIVPIELRGSHALILEPSRKALHTLDFKPVDIFIHDSDHSAKNVLFEMLWAWERMPKGGLLVVDNTESSWGVVSDFLSRRPLARYCTIVNVSEPESDRWETVFVRKG